MTKTIRICFVFTALAGLASSMPGPSTAFAAAPSSRLAVTVSAETPDGSNRQNLEDLLMIELGNQRFLQLVDRQDIRAILQEHRITLSNLNDAHNAAALGKFANADYLLHVVAAGEKVSIRLVEVATGQVNLEEQLRLGKDLSLLSASIREKVLAAVQPQSQAVRRLTVGVAALVNRSGADRSDKLGVALQTALRKRLKDEPWAVVLERQYPTALLEEVDLTRLGLARGGPETLPPADLVILGTMEDVGSDYVPGKPWTIRLDLTFRLRDQSKRVERTCRSDAIELAADDLIRDIEAFRRLTTPPRSAVGEKELWRRQALYLLPPSGRPQLLNGLASPEERKEGDVIETIRAWENVLLLDADNAEAMTNLGVCLIALHQRKSTDARVAATQREAATQRCTVGSQLVQRAMAGWPTPERAKVFWQCALSISVAAPPRAKEMAQYMGDNRHLFKGLDSLEWAVADKLRKESVLNSDDSLTAFHAELDRAIRNVEKNPDALFLAFENFERCGKGSTEESAVFLARYLDSPDPVVQFLVHRWTGEFLCWGKSAPAGFRHFDQAIEASEAARKRVSVYYRSEAIRDIYRRKILACEQCGQPEEAKKTVLAAARHFLQTRQSDISSAWVYHYCVTKVLGRGQEQEALAMCNACLAKADRRGGFACYETSRILAKREELLATLAGKPVPGPGGLRLAKGTGCEHFMIFLRMAGDADRLWLASPRGPNMTFGSALLYRPSLDETRRLTDVREPVRSVASLQGSAFFGGGADGLYQLDHDGNLLKHYSRQSGAFPIGHVVDVREGGGKIYVCYRSSDRYGVAALDPASGSLTVLAPSSRQASPETEPVADVQRLWWDGVAGRLYAGCHDRAIQTFPRFLCQYGLMPDGKTWHKYQGPEAPRFVVSDGDEALVVRVPGKAVEFSFTRSGKKVLVDLPLPSLMGDPAWDEHRIWVPTAAGLYEIDRATSGLTWLAYQSDNPFFSVLRLGGRLYVATSRGLYCRDIPPYSKTASIRK